MTSQINSVSPRIGVINKAKPFVKWGQKATALEERQVGCLEKGDPVFLFWTPVKSTVLSFGTEQAGLTHRIQDWVQIAVKGGDGKEMSESVADEHSKVKDVNSKGLNKFT